MPESNGLCLHATPKFQVVGLAGESATHAAPLQQPSQQLHVPPSKRISVFLDVNEPYTRQLIRNALQHPLRAPHFQVTLGRGHGMDGVPLPSTCTFQWSEYERIDWSAVLAGKHGASSYCVRKGLSRKAQLAHYTKLYLCKHPDSLLREALPQTVILDTWSVWENEGGGNKDGFADIVIGDSSTSVNRRERLDRCLQEARQAMSEAERAHEVDPAKASPPIWILKPSTINKGAGIQIVHLYEQIVDICWSESDIREWVLQRYISPPLLLRRRKFHIRAYALAVSAIRVYLSREALALSSGTPYKEHDTSNAFAHITNTAYQDLDPNFSEDECVRVWRKDVIVPILLADGTCRSTREAEQRVQVVMDKMERITGEVFRAYKNEFGVFAPIEGCFEHYGLDFVVDKNWSVFLLEINPGPDFKQTGNTLSPMIERLMGDTADVALLDLPDGRNPDGTQCARLALVYENDMFKRGRRNGGNGINMKLT